MNESNSSDKLPVLDESRERGVQNPRVIDLIQPSPDKTRVELHLMESREWDSHPDQRDQLAEKFNNYLDYVMDGYFHEEYPDYRDFPVEFVFSAPLPREEVHQKMIQAMADYCVGVSIRFRFEPVREGK